MTREVNKTIVEKILESPLGQICFVIADTSVNYEPFMNNVYHQRNSSAVRQSVTDVGVLCYVNTYLFMLCMS